MNTFFIFKIYFKTNSKKPTLHLEMFLSRMETFTRSYSALFRSEFLQSLAWIHNGNPLGNLIFIVAKLKFIKWLNLISNYKFLIFIMFMSWLVGICGCFRINVILGNELQMAEANCLIFQTLQIQFIHCLQTAKFCHI